MTRSREEIHALCRARGIETTRLWASQESQALSEIEKGYAQELVEILFQTERQTIYNNEVLNQAKKANNIAWIAAIASVVSAFTACLVVILDK